MALIELDHISKAYDLGLSKVLALRDIDIAIDVGGMRGWFSPYIRL